MKKILSLLLIFTLLFSNSVFANEINQRTNSVGVFSLSDSKLEEKLNNSGLPNEVINDILYNASKNSSFTNVNISKVVENPKSNNLLGFLFSTKSANSVTREHYFSEYYNVQIDGVVNGSKATSICNFGVAVLGEVFDSIDFFMSGYTILEEFRAIYGQTSVYTNSGNSTVVDGDIDTRIDKFTYVDINDGTGYRLGLITQELQGLNLEVEAKVFNSETRTYIVENVLTLTNEDFESPNYDFPNSAAEYNARLNQYEDERLTLEIGPINIEVK